MLAPFWLLISIGLDLNFPAILVGFLIFVVLSCYYLARSASSLWEALKVLAIPLFFILIGIYGATFGHKVLNDFAMQGVGFIAPAWLSEILRYKAHNRKIHNVAIYFLIQHGLTLLVALHANWSFGFISPSFFFPLILIWYFSYPIGFVLFQRQLVLFAVKNERKVRD